MNPCLETINGIQMNRLGFREQVMKSLIEKEMKNAENGQEEFAAFLKAQESNAFRFSLESEKISESLKQLKERNERQREEITSQKRSAIETNLEEWKKYKKGIEEKVNELLFEFEVRSDVIKNIKINTQESMQLILKQIEEPRVPRKRPKDENQRENESEIGMTKNQREEDWGDTEMETGRVNPLKWLTLGSGIGSISERSSMSQRRRVDFARSLSPEQRRGPNEKNEKVNESFKEISESEGDSARPSVGELSDGMSNSSSLSGSSSKGKKFLIKSAQGRPASNQSKGSSRNSSALGLSELSETSGKTSMSGQKSERPKEELRTKDVRHMKYARQILPTLKSSEKKMKLAKSKVPLESLKN